MLIKEILLVDNQAPIISAIGFILQSRGYLAIVAPDPETASAELDNYCFDLMLVYLNGPEEDKLALLRQAKQKPSGPRIIVAGNPRKLPLPMESLQGEVDDCLPAPFSSQELCRCVDKLLKQDMAKSGEFRAEEINARIFNSLRLTFRDLHNSFVSVLSGLSLVKNNMVNQDDCNIFGLLVEVSKDVSRCINISEDFLYKALLYTSEYDLKITDKLRH